MKVTFVIDERGAFHAQKTIGDLPTDKSMMVTIQKVTRTLAHNAVQWPILNAFSQQLLWPVNGAMCKLTGEEWKDILMIHAYAKLERLYILFLSLSIYLPKLSYLLPFHQ